MKQKIVIKVHMTSERCRSKAMALVAATGGVDSVALAGADRDQVVVVGESVDSIKLTSALRKKVGPSELLQVAEDKKDDKKPPAPAAAPAPQLQYWTYPPPPPAGVVYHDPAAAWHAYGHAYQAREETCSIM